MKVVKYKKVEIEIEKKKFKSLKTDEWDNL